jgi:hypothetical protein
LFFIMSFNWYYIFDDLKSLVIIWTEWWGHFLTIFGRVHYFFYGVGWIRRKCNAKAVSLVGEFGWMIRSVVWDQQQSRRTPTKSVKCFSLYYLGWRCQNKRMMTTLSNLSLCIPTDWNI